MHAYRLPGHRRRLVCLYGFGLLLLLALAARARAGLGTGQRLIAAATTASAVTDTWQTYRNEQAGYTVEYPADWTVEEQAGADGEILTMFTPPHLGAAIEVSVRTGGAGGEEFADIPHTRCWEVMVGGLPGTTCFDTISFSTVTTIGAGDKTYTIAVVGKRPDPTIYQRFLDSFTVIP